MTKWNRLAREMGCILIRRGRLCPNWKFAWCRCPVGSQDGGPSIRVIRAHGFFVTSLDLADTDLTNLENLSSLKLSQNERITNRGVAALAALTNIKLKSLALYGCLGIEDGRGLDNLKNGLPSLKCLRLNSASDEDGIVAHGNGIDHRCPLLLLLRHTTWSCSV